MAADVAGARLRQASAIASELRRAINRQRNELGHLRSLDRRAAPPARPPGDDARPNPAPVTYERKSYAPAAIGTVTPRTAAAAPASAPAPVEAVPMVSNLGTRVDVLA